MVFYVEDHAGAEVNMARKKMTKTKAKTTKGKRAATAKAGSEAKTKTRPEARGKRRGREAGPKNVVERLAETVQREVRARLGPDATFEQHNDAAAAIMNEVLWKREDRTLREEVTDDEEVDVDGKRYLTLPIIRALGGGGRPVRVSAWRIPTNP